MARLPQLTLVHDVIGGPTGMGLVAERIAGAVLDQGWRLTLVADRVTSSLAGSCTVRRARWPARLPATVQTLAWAAAAARALSGVRADLVHVHAPALLRVADLMTCHHLAHASWEHGVRERGTGPTGAARRLQDFVNRHIDDSLYRHRPQTPLSFVSAFLRAEFTRRYGTPVGGWVLPPPAASWQPYERPSAAGRKLVVGYLGGDDPRKGVGDVMTLADEEDLEVLIAGPGSERLVAGGRAGLGFVDLTHFLQECDVVAAPALFDAAPVAVLEALARDIPVVVRETNGWAEPIVRFNAGAVWNGREPLAAAIRRGARTPSTGRRLLTEEFSAREFDRRLFSIYERILDS